MHQGLVEFDLQELEDNLDDSHVVTYAEMTFNVHESENTCRPEWRGCWCVLTVFAATERWPSGTTFRPRNPDEVSTFKRVEVGGYPVRDTGWDPVATFPGLTGYVQDWVNGIRENFGFVIAPPRNPLPSTASDFREEFNNDCFMDISTAQLHVTIARRAGT